MMDKTELIIEHGNGGFGASDGDEVEVTVQGPQQPKRTSINPGSQLPDLTSQPHDSETQLSNSELVSSASVSVSDTNDAQKITEASANTSEVDDALGAALAKMTNYPLPTPEVSEMDPPVPPVVEISDDDEEEPAPDEDIEVSLESGN